MRNLFFISVLFFVIVAASIADARKEGHYGSQYGGDPNYHFVKDAYEARQIMGSRFYGQEELEEIFGTYLNRHTVWKMNRVPFHKSTLRRCSDCILFYYLPHFGLRGASPTIWNFLSSNKIWIRRSFADNKRVAWYKGQRFAHKAPKEGWYLIRMTVRGRPVGALTGSYSLGPRERIASASVYVYAMLLNNNLFRGKYVRTLDNNDKNQLDVLVGRPKGKIVILSIMRSNLGIAPEILPDARR